MIYFVQAKDTGYIKIGFSNNPMQRFKSLQRESFHFGRGKLIILKVTDGSISDEAKLHQQFCDCNVRGEWFYPRQCLLDFIEHSDPLDNNEIEQIRLDILARDRIVEQLDQALNLLHSCVSDETGRRLTVKWKLLIKSLGMNRTEWSYLFEINDPLLWWLEKSELLSGES